jgi:hypothetical protein
MKRRSLVVLGVIFAATPSTGRRAGSTPALSPFESIVRADIPAGYQGKPFDPAVAGGPMLPAGVTAGPYPIPGRLEFENYDMGGLNVGYFTADHIMCGASGYRKDGVAASLCATSPAPDTIYGAPKGDVYYDTGDPTLDGTTYPRAGATDVYIGAVRPGDWVNITVDVQTAGTYQIGSTWASGNGPPGKEGGNGAMELQVFVNGTKELDWTAVFPGYATLANFHDWKPYPNMGTITLAAGLQVIKLDTGADPHLNLDYVQFSLVQPDGGLDSTGGEAGSPGDGGSAPSGDAAGTSETGGDAGNGDGPSAASPIVGAVGAQTTTSGCSCRVVPPGPDEEHLPGALATTLALLLVTKKRRPVSLRHLQE